MRCACHFFWNETCFLELLDPIKQHLKNHKNTNNLHLDIKYLNKISTITNFLFQYFVRTSPFRSVAYSLRCKTEKFEASLFPRRSRRRCLRTADRRAPVPEAAVVHPKCAKSSSGAHALPSPTKADTPRCSAMSTSYCRRPRPALCTTSRCRLRQHRHCLCRARWHIDRPPHRAHPQRCAGDHSIPYLR
jgi:hypothetical protein